MGIEYYSAVLVGTLLARLTDPIVFAGIIPVMLVCGYLRIRSWWAIPVTALIATGINVAAVWSWWRQLGIAANWPQRIMWILVSFLIIAALAYGIGRLGARLFSAGPKTKPKG